MSKYKNEDEIIEALHNHFFITEVNGADWFDQIMNQVVDVIRSVPERRGRWMDHSDEWDGGYYECSVCGEAFTFIEGTPKENLYNYCPNCGARMEV